MVVFVELIQVLVDFVVEVDILFGAVLLLEVVHAKEEDVLDLVDVLDDCAGKELLVDKPYPALQTYPHHLSPELLHVQLSNSLSALYLLHYSQVLH